jgi:hypothetical protein
MLPEVVETKRDHDKAPIGPEKSMAGVPLRRRWRWRQTWKVSLICVKMPEP